jgi:hypothetical protein
LKKAAAISFLLIFLFTNTELKQLLKLPVLIHHYMEHNKEDAGKTLLAFLYEHYAEEHVVKTPRHHDKDHENLPFKSHHTGISQVPVFCVSVTAIDCTIDAVLPASVKNVYTEPSHYPSALSKIWQPPRSC